MADEHPTPSWRQIPRRSTGVEAGIGPPGAPTEPRRPPEPVRFSEDRRAEIRDAVRTGALRRLRRGVYLPPTDETGVARIREAEALARICAVASRLTTSYVFSHTSASLVHGCWTWHLDPVVHIIQSVTPHLGSPRDPWLRRHGNALPDEERATVVGLPVTSLERTVVDCASILTPVQAIVIADSALRIGADRSGIARILEARAGARGVRNARRVVARADPRSGSPGESIARWHVLERGLPEPGVQIEVDTHRGVAWVDIGWRDLKVGLEFDGRATYGDGEDAWRRLAEEKARHDALDEAGWTLVRVSWEDLADPARLERRIRAAFVRARRRYGLAPIAAPNKE